MGRRSVSTLALPKSPSLPMASPAANDMSDATDEQVLSVSQFTTQLKGVVESEFSQVWVAGEISNFSRPQSGHCYFTLKDDSAQLRAVIWRGTASRLKFELADGLEVVCRGHVDVYPPRGSYQLVVEQLTPQGVGALELALRKLREKLSREGLFDSDSKRPLPTFPRRIGVVTSPTGAAIRDFLEVLRRRWRGVEVLVFPTRVQGDGAAEEIAEAIQLANACRPQLDVLVVGRGGGSLEDLWCFNEEETVRAIAASKIPTISAVGHEIDVTLADLAADVRALTPSEAAERVVPSSQEVLELLQSRQVRMQSAMKSRSTELRNRLEALASRPALARPLDAVHNLGRQVDECSARLKASVGVYLRNLQSQMATVSGKLETLSPLGVLGRGYSITHSQKTGRVVNSVRQMKQGEMIETRLADGIVSSTVDEIKQN